VIAFHCRVCEAQLFFENSVCISCGTALGYSRVERAIVPLDAQGRYADQAGLVWWVCRNLGESGCTWLARLEGGQCEACDLTRARPEPATKEYREAEIAKRHLVFELDRIGLPLVSRLQDPEEGLCFDLLQSDGDPATQDVVIGHESGVITIDLAESDAAYREKVREALAEPYRTMLGHFRHETGHYYEWQLVRGEERMAECTRLFGDESASYQEAIKRHYSDGPPADWAERYISTYATMHPFEDFAETFAHYLHIRDTIESAIHLGLAAYAPLDGAFRRVVEEQWIPLSTALNVVNRSMGRDDLYPFVIPGPVLDKLEYVAGLVPR